MHKWLVLGGKKKFLMFIPKSRLKFICNIIAYGSKYL